MKLTDFFSQKEPETFTHHDKIARDLVNRSHANIKVNLEVVREKIKQKQQELESLQKAERIYIRAKAGIEFTKAENKPDRKFSHIVIDDDPGEVEDDPDHEKAFGVK